MFTALVVALALAGANSELEAAQRAYADVDYARCFDKARAALGQPGTLSERVAASRLVGLCAAAQGDTDAARDAFRFMLTLDKNARLPEGLSPRFTSSFREARGALMESTPLALTIVKDDIRGASRILRVRVQDDGDLVARVGFRPKGGGLESPVKKSVELELEVPAAIDVELVALDPAGGEVAILEVAGVGSGPVRDLKEGPAPPAEEPAPFPWLVVGGVAGAVVLVGGGAAILAVVLSPPSTVTLKTDVVFSPP